MYALVLYFDSYKSEKSKEGGMFVMKKRLLSTLLALALCLGLLPTVASAAEQESLPDWYFLFAVFKNLDADVKDGNGKMQHMTYSMPREEVDLIRDLAAEFEKYMNSAGVMRTYIEVVEIDGRNLIYILPEIKFMRRLRMVGELAIPILS